MKKLYQYKSALTEITASLRRAGFDVGVDIGQREEKLVLKVRTYLPYI